MARLLLASALMCMLATPVFAQETDQKEETKLELKSAKQKGSYAIGYQIGGQLKGQGMRPAIEALIAGLQDALKAADPQVPLEEMQAAVREFSVESRTELANINKKEGEEFLAKNKKKEGVVTLESGLQYEVIKKGDGDSPGRSDRVTTHYHGTLIDGTVFDSSVERGQPATFGVGMVIPGWTEALQKMKVGDKWRLFIPSDLAYGVRGAGDSIGPNATLIFEVELLEIAK